MLLSAPPAWPYSNPSDSAHARPALDMKPLRLWPFILLAGAAACSGPIATRSGLAGPVVAATTPVALAAAPDAAGSAYQLASMAVADALRHHGYRLAADAPMRIEIGISERGAEAAVLPLAGPALSSAKAPRLLQNCQDRTHRLTLAVYDPAQPGMTRTWAEEHHCRGNLAESMAALADQAVSALAGPALDGRSERTGKD
jgi:hypothetical protein